MKMYIGNPTKQNHDFLYWVPMGRSPRTQRIPVGGQIMLSGELDREAVDYVIQQHAPFGMAAASEVEYVKDYIGLCYAIDKPIPAATLTKMMIHNNDVLASQGKEIRRQVSIVGNEGLEQSAQESGRPEQLRQLEVSIMEQNHDDRSPEPAVSEGFRVIRGGADTPPPTTRRAARRARRAGV